MCTACTPTRFLPEHEPAAALPVVQSSRKVAYSSCFARHAAASLRATRASAACPAPAAFANPPAAPTPSPPSSAFCSLDPTQMDRDTNEEPRPYSSIPLSMSAGAIVFISGATGPWAAAINGPYDRTGEISDGYAVYSKRGDPSMCLEHRGERWQVKPVSNKGKSAAVAAVAGGCALEDCTSRVWRVDDGVPEHPLIDQSSVKMATGRESERLVSGGCMRAHAHARDAAAPRARARVSPCDNVRFCTGRRTCCG